jgi:hypothetical protein
MSFIADDRRDRRQRGTLSRGFYKLQNRSLLLSELRPFEALDGPMLRSFINTFGNEAMR